MTDNYPPFGLDQGGTEPAPIEADDMPRPTLPSAVDLDVPVGDRPGP